ncbi:hypothetical protein NFI96_032947 [Prochilodus magdalenae]|nr:hypothetical protein NFI96_032947 [Prochilodus magdalenae]
MRLLTPILFLILHSPHALIAVQKLETIEFNEMNALTCGQGLTDCKVNRGNLDCNDRGYVSGLAAEGLLCHNQVWRPCLRIQLIITTEGPHEDSVVSGEPIHEDSDESDEEHVSSLGNPTDVSDLASVQVCYSSPEFTDSKELTFTPHISAEHPTQMWMSLVVELKEDHFGSLFTIYSSATSNFSKQVTLPSIDAVCSQDLDIPLCDMPIVRKEIDHTTGMFKLHINDTGRDIVNELGACQKKDKDCIKLEWKDNPLMIPMSYAAPCLCFQVWWKTSKFRKEFCPFNDTVLSGLNVSVSAVEQTKTNYGTVHKNTTAVVWNITAPCRLEAEIQLCKKTVSGTGCHEIHDSAKTRPHTHRHHHLKWTWVNQQWLSQGEFVGVERHPSLCVQFKVKGMEGHFKRVCPFEVTRTHWSSVFLVCVVLMCLTVLGVYAVQGALKGWVFRWLKVDDIRGAVGGRQVVLLYPPDADSGLAELVCRLGSGLSSLGFNVSLDLWSRSELCALGPVPWLHSRLDRVQRNGGKVVLVLTQAAWGRVEEWGRRAGAREELKMGNDEDSRNHVLATPYSDVFSASLSCILADYLQGRAGERFVLAQFEAQPAGPPGAGGPLPELFRGLPLFSLPSQSLSFLTELANGTQKRQAGRPTNRRMRAGVLRAGSRTLAEALRELKGGTGYKLVGLSQGFRTEDPWESIPLQQGHSSPMPSPDLHNKSSTVNWV